MPMAKTPASLPGQKMPKAAFSQPYKAIYVYEKDCVLDKLIVLAVVYVYAHGYIYGWLKVAIGICCLGKLAGGIFCLGKRGSGSIF